MKILVLDTSGSITRWVGVIDGDVIKPVEMEMYRRHDEQLAEGIQRWLRDANWKHPDLLAVVKGPGGYTGLRVGVSFAVAYALARKLQILPISSFEAIAARTTSDYVLAALPLRKNTCRLQLMKSGIIPEPIGDEIEAAVDELPEFRVRGFSIAGEGYDIYREHFDKAYPESKMETGELKAPSTALGLLAYALSEVRESLHPLEMDVEYGGEFLPTVRK